MIPLIPLVSLERAVEHLHVPIENESEVRQKVILASGIVMNHMKLEAIPEEWIVSDDSPLPDPQPSGGIPRSVLDTDTISVVSTLDEPPVLIRVPPSVQSAVLLILSEIFENREASTSNPLSDAVISLLSAFRDPTFS